MARDGATFGASRMKGDMNLPEGWQGSYGTLNMGRALADIHARLLALEAQNAPQPGPPYSAVHIRRRINGTFDSHHITLHHSKPLDFNTACEWLLSGRNNVFVEPTDAGAVLDVLEADGKQAQ